MFSAIPTAQAARLAVAAAVAPRANLAGQVTTTTTGRAPR
jgi:hypothetical protein